MVHYNEFEEFEVGSNLLRAAFSTSGDVEREWFVPRTAVFSTPSLSNGDTFNFHQALESASGLGVTVLGAAGAFPIALKRVAVMEAYIEDDSISDIMNATVFPGNPPRYRFGSYTESVNGVVTKYGLLHYRRQAFGRRLLFLDRDFSWGVYGVVLSGPPLDRVSYLFRDYIWHIEHCHSISLHLESGLVYDENEGDEDFPSLPPNIVPLTFTIYGRFVFDYAGYYSHPDTSDGVQGFASVAPIKMVPHGVGWDGGATPL